MYTPKKSERVGTRKKKKKTALLCAPLAGFRLFFFFSSSQQCLLFRFQGVSGGGGTAAAVVDLDALHSLQPVVGATPRLAVCVLPAKARVAVAAPLRVFVRGSARLVCVIHTYDTAFTYHRVIACQHRPRADLLTNGWNGNRFSVCASVQLCGARFRRCRRGRRLLKLDTTTHHRAIVRTAAIMRKKQKQLLETHFREMIPECR